MPGQGSRAYKEYEDQLQLCQQNSVAVPEGTSGNYLNKEGKGRKES